jgi:hypothetical protein
MLLKYLQNVQQGKAVNYQKLLALLPPAFYQRRTELFKVKASGAGKWQVSIADAALFQALLQSAGAPADRVTASLQGDSHRVQTSHCYLLLYHAGCAGPRPDLALATGSTSGDGQPQLSLGFTPKSTLLLIENEENFFRYPQVLVLCNQMLVQPFSLADCDVALAAGSRIGSALLSPLLAQYRQIYCAFDFDCAGLEVFDHLHKRYGAKVQLVVPPDLTPWLDGFRAEPKTASQLQRAVELADQHQLYGLAQAFLQRKRFLEQEVLLAAPQTGREAEANDA